MTTVIRLVTVVDLDDSVVPAEVSDALVNDGRPPGGFEPAAVPMVHGEPVYNASDTSFRRCTWLTSTTVAGPPCSMTGAGVCTAVPTSGSRRPSRTSRTTLRRWSDPDEAFGNHSQADMAAAHWPALADTFQEHGVLVDPEELNRLPHDVKLTKRVRDRLFNT